MPTQMPVEKEDQLIINNLCWGLIANPRFDKLIEQSFSKLEARPELVNSKTLAGYSAIYYAVKMGDLEVINRLIKLGANLNELYEGLSLRDLAQQEIIMGGDQ